MANDLPDLLVLSTQVLEPRIDQLELNRCKVEGIDASVKFVRAMRPIVRSVRVPVKQRRPIVRWSMCAVPFNSGCVLLSDQPNTAIIRHALTSLTRADLERVHGAVGDIAQRENAGELERPMLSDSATESVDRRIKGVGSGTRNDAICEDFLYSFKAGLAARSATCGASGPRCAAHKSDAMHQPSTGWHDVGNDQRIGLSWQKATHV